MFNYPLILLFCLYSVFCFGSGLYYSNLLNTKKNEILKNENLSTLNKLERYYTDKQNNIIKNYLGQIDELKQIYDNQIKELENEKYKDSFIITNNDINKCMQSDTDNKQDKRELATKENKPDFICYTKTDFYSKIKRSLDIATECDKLAIQYNKLLEVCTIE